MAYLKKYGRFARFVQAAKGIKIETTPNFSEAKMVFSGFGYGDLNHVGHINPDGLALRAEGCRINLWKDGFSGSSPKTDHGLGVKAVEDLARRSLFFMVRSQYSIKPGFYNPDHYYHPIESTLSLCKIGRTSFQVRQVDVSTKTKEVLAVTTIAQVLADKETRKPTPHPRSFLEAVEGRITGTPLTEYTPEEDSPPGAHKLRTRFHWSDADYYYHINQSSYLRLSLDAAYEAAADGALTGVDRALGNYQIIETDSVYRKEVSPGSEVDVYSWTKPDQPTVIHTKIVQDDVPVFLMKLDIQPC